LHSKTFYYRIDALLFNRSKERDYVDMHDFSITLHVNCMDESVIKREWLSRYNPKWHNIIFFTYFKTF